MERTDKSSRRYVALTLEYYQKVFGNNSFTIDIAFIALLVGTVGIIITLCTSVNQRLSRSLL